MQDSQEIDDATRRAAIEAATAHILEHPSPRIEHVAPQPAPFPVPDFHSNSQKSAFVNKLVSGILKANDKPAEKAWQTATEEAHKAIAGFVRYQRRLAEQAMEVAEKTFEEGGKLAFTQGEIFALDMVSEFIAKREANIAAKAKR